MPSIPRHIAVIMDGNGRWAQSRGLPRKAGHRAGAESVREAVDACLDIGTEFLTLYAFSSENWNRPKEEISTLMKLLEQFLKTKGKEFMKKNVRLRTIGRIDRLPDSCRAQLDRVVTETAGNTALTVILALSYGSREEIVDATRRIAQKDRRIPRPRSLNPDLWRTPPLKFPPLAAQLRRILHHHQELARLRKK